MSAGYRRTTTCGEIAQQLIEAYRTGGFPEWNREFLDLYARVDRAVTRLRGGAIKEDRRHEVVWLPRSDGDDWSLEVEWQAQSPSEFMADLLDRARFHGYCVVILYGYHRNWIKESDTAVIREWVGSDLPCPRIIGPWSSDFYPDGRFITLGRIAEQLLEGYETGGFPAWNRYWAEEAPRGQYD
jgi:hypothetical protein